MSFNISYGAVVIKKIELPEVLITFKTSSFSYFELIAAKRQPCVLQ